jgi:hypothetical protein
MQNDDGQVSGVKNKTLAEVKADIIANRGNWRNLKKWVANHRLFIGKEWILPAPYESPSKWTKETLRGEPAELLSYLYHNLRSARYEKNYIVALDLLEKIKIICDLELEDLRRLGAQEDSGEFLENICFNIKHYEDKKNNAENAYKIFLFLTKACNEDRKFRLIQKAANYYCYDEFFEKFYSCFKENWRKFKKENYPTFKNKRIKKYIEIILNRYRGILYGEEYSRYKLSIHFDEDENDFKVDLINEFESKELKIVVIKSLDSGASLTKQN